MKIRYLLLLLAVCIVAYIGLYNINQHEIEQVKIKEQLYIYQYIEKVNEYIDYDDVYDMIRDSMLVVYISVDIDKFIIKNKNQIRKELDSLEILLMKTTIKEEE